MHDRDFEIRSAVCLLFGYAGNQEIAAKKT